MTPVLEARDLAKSFGAVIAAGDINVTIHEGELIAVIGSNGAGKTTFINMVTGYLKPTSGSILFRGRDITGRPPRSITRIGICRSFQVAQLFPELSVIENMMIASSAIAPGGIKAFQPLFQPDAEAQSREALEAFGIGDRADDSVAALPQGVRKLLDIAMALVGQPAVLLLDEPTSGVAIEEKFPLMDTVMRGVRASGSSVLFVEHDMEIVSRYAERVIAFYDGHVIADGPTEEALNDPRVKEFISGECVAGHNARQGSHNA